MELKPADICVRPDHCGALHASFTVSIWTTHLSMNPAKRSTRNLIFKFQLPGTRPLPDGAAGLLAQPAVQTRPRDLPGAWYILCMRR